MALGATANREEVPKPVVVPGIRWRADALFVAALLVLAVLLADPRKGHFSGLPTIALAGVASLLLFAVTGEALARVLVPEAWGALVPLFALPLGPAWSSLVLTVLVLAHLPLHVTLWLILAASVLASVLVRRGGRAASSGRGHFDRRQLGSW